MILVLFVPIPSGVIVSLFPCERYEQCILIIGILQDFFRNTSKYI